jgi:hypothetical protein
VKPLFIKEEHFIPEQSIIHSHRYENLKSNRVFLYVEVTLPQKGELLPELTALRPRR